jgi:CRISPR/Cas system-associated endoribonuclease Cas2
VGRGAKWALILGAVVAAAALTVGAAMLGWRARGRTAEIPDPEKQEPKDIVKFLASPEFAARPEPERYRYFRTLADGSPERVMRYVFAGNLNDAEREKLEANVRPLMQKMMKERMDEYFAKSSEERAAFLDKEIDRMQERRKEWEARRAQDPSAASRPPDTVTPGASASNPAAASAPGTPGPRGPHGFSPERLRQRIEETDPATRAQFVQFMLDMRARMKARGLEGSWRGPMPPPPPPAANAK